jgi:hypothetical protein
MGKKKSEKPKLLITENYLLFAKASAGSKMFRTVYYEIGRKKIDVLRDGDLSCAVFVSAILKLFNLIDDVHTTVNHTVRSLKLRGWKPIKKPVPGAIIVWAPKTSKKSGETHRHIGFYLGNGKAVSNNSKKRSPAIHAWTFRPVEEILYKNI